MHESTRRLWAWRDEFGAESEWAERLGSIIGGWPRESLADPYSPAAGARVAGPFDTAQPGEEHDMADLEYRVENGVGTILLTALRRRMPSR